MRQINILELMMINQPNRQLLLSVVSCIYMAQAIKTIFKNPCCQLINNFLQLLFARVDYSCRMDGIFTSMN